MSVTFLFGSISDALDIAGRTVCQARESLRALYSVPDDAEVTLNGQPANENDVLRDGDKLHFGKSLASKGFDLTITVGA